MPRVTFFVYSEGIQGSGVPPQVNVSVINPKIVLAPAFIPGQFSFGIAAGIIDLNVDVQVHKFQYIFTSPEGEELINSGEVVIPENILDVRLPVELRGAVIALDFKNVTMIKEGTYSSEVIVDNESLGKFSIPVKGLNINA